MEINSNLNAMRLQEVKLNDSAKNIANTRTYANPSNEEATQEVTPDLIKSITEQIPIPISYQANATSIKVQNEIFASTINIKA
jgi:flagellar basal body rod protein FlgC